VEKKARMGINYIDKLDFLEAFPKARDSAFKTENIQNSFSVAGLAPFNPDSELSQLDIQLKTPTPPGSRSTNSAPKTRYATRQLERQASAVRKSIRERAQSPSSSVEMRDKLIKGHELHLNELILSREEIRKLRADNEWQGQKWKLSSRKLAITEG
jgi:hypothetical protein